MAIVVFGFLWDRSDHLRAVTTRGHLDQGRWSQVVINVTHRRRRFWWETCFQLVVKFLSYRSEETHVVFVAGGTTWSRRPKGRVLKIRL